MLLVAILTIEHSKLDEFREYERAAALIMARHGGQIERVLVMAGAEGAPTAPPPPLPKEKRGGIMGAIDKVASEIDRGVEKVLHPSDPPPGSLRELHILSFPNEAAYDAYRFDGELAQLAPTRARCVSKTEIWRAEDGPRY